MSTLTMYPEARNQDVAVEANAQTREADGIQLKLASDSAELEGAFRLIYRAYHRAGLIDSRSDGLRVTRHQLEETTEIFVAIKDDEVISTLSLIGDGREGLPIDKVFGPEIEALRKEFQIAEVSCLADRRESVVRSLPLLLRLQRLMFQSADLRGIECVVIAVHPRHARYYQRLLGFKQIGEQREYGAVLGQPAVAMYKHLDYPYAPNTEVFESYFAVPCPREQLQRPSPRSPEFVQRMQELAIDS
jgi:hypothetical protein